jgi:soluble lytic murein transglycosylase-like protein
LKIQENTAELHKPIGRLKRQDLPGVPDKPEFAALLARYHQPKGPQAQQESKNAAPMTLQDYRTQALPVRLRVEKQKAAYEALLMAGESNLNVPEGIQKAIDEAARKHQLPAKLISAVIKVESNFNPRAVSSEGASGLMQLMPATARQLGVKNSFDIKQNIDGGSRYLKQMMERFDGKLDLALAAYNAGPNAVTKHGGIPPYRETQNYVKKVMAYC